MTATSGSKNIIFLLDTSGSMDGDKMDLAKKAAKSVVNTLSNSDFVGIVSFNSLAQILNDNGQIIRATD